MYIFCQVLNTLPEPGRGKKHINTKLFTKNATFWRAPDNVLVESLIIVSRMIALIIPVLLGLFSMYSDSIVTITFSL